MPIISIGVEHKGYRRVKDLEDEGWRIVDLKHVLKRDPREGGIGHAEDGTHTTTQQIVMSQDGFSELMVTEAKTHLEKVDKPQGTIYVCRSGCHRSNVCGHCQEEMLNEQSWMDGSPVFHAKHFPCTEYYGKNGTATLIADAQRWLTSPLHENMSGKVLDIRDRFGYKACSRHEGAWTALFAINSFAQHTFPDLIDDVDLKPRTAGFRDVVSVDSSTPRLSGAEAAKDGSRASPSPRSAPAAAPRSAGGGCFSCLPAPPPPQERAMPSSAPPPLPERPTPSSAPGKDKRISKKTKIVKSRTRREVDEEQETSRKDREVDEERETSRKSVAEEHGEIRKSVDEEHGKSRESVDEEERPNKKSKTYDSPIPDFANLDFDPKNWWHVLDRHDVDKPAREMLFLLGSCSAAGKYEAWNLLRQLTLDDEHRRIRHPSKFLYSCSLKAIHEIQKRYPSLTLPSRSNGSGSERLS